MATSVSITVVMQDDKRGDPSRKPPPRLPIIAPKDDHSSSASSSRSGHPTSSGPSIPPRARLPPRSRTGCWTCRTRKVKCDEGRPICGQCTRLGHACDYNPRLSFRDDTPRVVERMQDITVIGSSIWDPTSPTATDTSQDTTIDDLPPFASLTTDEERERKAERSSPGTYHVVVYPESFQHLPEYNDDVEIKKEMLSPLRRGSIAVSLSSSIGRDSSGFEGVPLPGDPNTILLPRFEDIARRSTFGSKDARSPTSPLNELAKIKLEETDSTVPSESDKSTGEANKNSDARYLDHFRDVVWRQLVPVEVEIQDSMIQSSAVVMETAAAYFPPLYHALMALSALSMAQVDDKERICALQHYHEALPALQSSLKSADDLTSDGAFLTHFVLLVYEIAAAETGHSNLWSQHLSTLLRISLLRRQRFGGERYPFILWWICNIDLDALFSGAGTGEFVGAMLKNDIIPPPSFHLYPLGTDGSSVVYTHELESLPTILQLDYEVTVLAVRLALLAQEFRHDTNFGRTDERRRDRDTRLRQGRIYELQEQLRQLWVAPAVVMIGQSVQALPLRSKALYQHAATLYRACIIYSHTSMWPSQRRDTSPDYDTEIAVASNQILQMTNKILAEGRSDCRFLVFPVFMAGFASTDGPQKRAALDLIGSMEKNSIGKNTRSARQALSTVYEHQDERFTYTGQSLDVGWMDVLNEQGLIVVNFGI